MAKCDICGKELIQFDESVDDKILALMDKDSIVLAETYPHSFDYCQSCGIVDYPFNENQIEELKAHSEELRDIVKEDIYKVVDPKQITKSCLLAGRCFEIVNDIDHAVLCYKACEDVLGALLLKYLQHNKSNGEINYNSDASNLTLSPDDYELMLGVENLLDEYRLKVINLTKLANAEENPVVIYNAILAFVGLNDIDKAKDLYNEAKKVFAGTNDTHDRALNYIGNVLIKSQGNY